MKTFLKLIRWKSILVATLVMFLIKYAIIIPVYQYYNILAGLSDTGFLFLVMSAMFILAGGNIINDYFDRKTDTINRPNKVLVGFTVNRRKAIFLHSAFTFIGIVFGFITAWFTGKFIVGLFFVFISFLIWLYSHNIKKKALLANVTLSFLVALIPLSVGITEYYALEKSLSEWDVDTARAIKMAFQTIIGISIFTFIINLIRELIKDCQDFIGDYKTGIKSVPIIIGKKNTNFLISIISILSVVFIVLMWEVYLSRLVFFQDNVIARIYVYLILIAPLLLLSIRSVWGINIIKYKRLNILTKFIMFFGILFTIIFSFAIYDKI